METKQLLSVALFITAMAVSSASFAQVKIGTNPTTIEANSNLEVEGSTAGRKMKVDKVTGQVTIADGTQGEGKILTSDAVGGSRWEAPSVQDTPVFLSVNKTGTANQQLGAGGTLTQVNYGTKAFDKSANFDLATDSFTVPANGAGYYQISGSYTCSPVTGQTFGIALYMYVNGTIVKSIVQSAQNGAGSITWKLNAGDVVTFYVQTSFAGATMTGAGMDVFMISK